MKKMMKENVENKFRQAERGVALIVALLAMTVIAGLGFALLVSSSTESLVNSSFRRASLAHYSAMAGVEELRGRMGPDARPIAADLTSVRIPCSTPATCPPLFNSHPVNASGGVPALSADLRKGYYIRINGTIDPTSTGCTYQGVSCYDSDPNRPTAPVFFTTSQPGTAMPYVWVKVQVATQRRLKRNLVTPCNPSDPSSAEYCDPNTLDNTLMVCWTGAEPRIAEDTNASADIVTVTDPSVCGDPANPLLIYTAMSIQPGSSGGTVRLVRELASVGRTPSLPGGLVLDGCPAAYPIPTNSGYSINGMDSASAGLHAHAIVTRCLADMQLIHTLIPDGNGGACTPEILTYPGCQRGNNRNVNHPGIGNNNCTNPNCNNTPESADVFYDPTLATDPVLGTCGGLQNLVSSIRSAAYQYGYVYPGGTTSIPTPGNGNPTNDPTQWNRVINVVTGNASLSQADFGAPGAGIILIEGNLDLSGYPTYNGLILVIGTGVVNVSGGGSGTVNGGLLIANTSTCTGPSDPPGPIVYNQTGGGTFNLNYNSDAINPLNGTLPVQKLSLNY